MSSTLILVQQGEASPIVARPIETGPIEAGPIEAGPIVANTIVDNNCFIIIILLLTLLAGGVGVPFLAAPVLRALLGALQRELVPALELQTKVHTKVRNHREGPY